MRATPGEFIDIRHHAAEGGVADLEITGVNDEPKWGSYGNADAVHHTVVDPYKLKLKIPERQLFLR